MQARATARLGQSESTRSGGQCQLHQTTNAIDVADAFVGAAEP